VKRGPEYILESAVPKQYHETEPANTVSIPSVAVVAKKQNKRKRPKESEHANKKAKKDAQEEGGGD
jgi:hypothetical protein